MRHSYLFTIGTACEILGVTRQAYYKRAVVKAELEDQVIDGEHQPEQST